MRDQNDEAPPRLFLKRLHDKASRCLIQRTRRLVGEKDPRSSGKRPRQGNPRLLPAGKERCLPVLQTIKTQP